MEFLGDDVGKTGVVPSMEENNSEVESDIRYYELEDFEYFPFGYRVAATIVHVIIFILGLVGNVVLIIVVRKNRSLQSPTFSYLVSIDRSVQCCILFVKES